MPESIRKHKKNHKKQAARPHSAGQTNAMLLELADFFKVLGDPTRLRILQALKAAESCVCDLSAALDMTQSAVSHQLAILRGARLVRTRREGRSVFYALDDEHIYRIMVVAEAHVSE